MSHNLARPKRQAEDYSRTHHDTDFTGQPSKKPRFDVRNPSALAPDAVEQDDTLDADVIGKRGQQVRRGAVNVDGYDSDSDTGNFDARADAKAKEKKASERTKLEEDNDMFADLEEDFRDGDDSEGDDKRRSGRKKAVRFLDEDEIEGQVKNSKSGGHVAADFSLNRNGKGKSAQDQDQESSSESEVDDETRASATNVDNELGAGSKKKHAPKLDAFNMQVENEEGRFDDQGNYVRKATDTDAVHDSWLEGISKKDMRKAHEAHEKREQERRAKDIEDDSQTAADLLGALIPLLEPGETVLEALARLGKTKSKKPRWQASQKQRNQPKDRVGTEERADDAAETQRRKAVEEITAAADRLLGRGQAEIYEAERELLTRQYRRETGEEWVDGANTLDGPSNNASGSDMWMYRWSDARDGGEAHGPYESAAIKQWIEAGYFDGSVEYRRDGSEGAWLHAIELS